MWEAVLCPTLEFLYILLSCPVVFLSIHLFPFLPLFYLWECLFVCDCPALYLLIIIFTSNSFPPTSVIPLSFRRHVLLKHPLFAHLCRLSPSFHHLISLTCFSSILLNNFLYRLIVSGWPFTCTPPPPPPSLHPCSPSSPLLLALFFPPCRTPPSLCLTPFNPLLSFMWWLIFTFSFQGKGPLGWMWIQLFAL